MEIMANANKGVTINVGNVKRKQRAASNQRIRSAGPGPKRTSKLRKRWHFPNRNRRRRTHLNTTGPKPAVSQTITATLGTVGSNLSDVVETECAVFLNPVVAKDSGGRMPVTSELDLLGQVLSEHPSLGNVGIFLIGIAVVGRILIQLGLSLRCHRRSQQHLAPLDQI